MRYRRKYRRYRGKRVYMIDIMQDFCRLSEQDELTDNEQARLDAVHELYRRLNKESCAKDLIYILNYGYVWGREKQCHLAMDLYMSERQIQRHVQTIFNVFADILNLI